MNGKMTIRLKKRPDPDAFSKNSYRTTIHPDGSYTETSYLNGKSQWHPKPKKKCR